MSVIVRPEAGLAVVLGPGLNGCLVPCIDRSPVYLLHRIVSKARPPLKNPIGPTQDY